VTRALALALLLASPAPAAEVTATPRGPTSSAPDFGPPTTIEQAMSRLLDEDVAGSADFIEAWAAAHPLDGGGRLSLGLLRLYQHRSEEAVTLLEVGLAGQHDPHGNLRIARNAAALAKGWAQAESDHFVVAYPKGKDEVLVPYLLETLEAQRAALAQDLGVAPPGKVRVEILPSPTDLARLSSLTEKEIRGSGTIALCKYNKLMLVSPKALVTGYDWLDTAAHEFTHYAVALKAGPRAPIWLHEGVAKWWESRWRGAGGQDYEPYAAALVRRAIETNALVTFEQMHPSMAKLPTQELATLAYAQVLLAVEHLVRRSGGCWTWGRPGPRPTRRWRRRSAPPGRTSWRPGGPTWRAARCRRAAPRRCGGCASRTIPRRAGRGPSGPTCPTRRRATTPGSASSCASGAAGRRPASSTGRRSIGPAPACPSWPTSTPSPPS
jgi:hypothetical protein